MAFCSACGAQVTGPFCGRCGARASSAGQAAAPPPQPPQPLPPQAPPPQAPPPQPYPPPPQPPPSFQAASGPPPSGQPYQAAPPYPPPPPPPVQPYQARPYAPQPVPPRKGTSPILIILMILGGLVVVGIIGAVVVVNVFIHKVKQAGFDPELMQRNPGLAISKMVTAFNPDVEVLNTNDRAGTITVRDRKTGKVVTLRFDDVRNGHFNMNVQEDGKSASLSFGDTSSRQPSWVPAYPGAKMNGGFAATSSDEHGDAGTYNFTTSDSPQQVRNFYEERARQSGMVVEATADTPLGTSLKITDPGSQRNLGVMIMGNGPTTVQVSYATR